MWINQTVFVVDLEVDVMFVVNLREVVALFFVVMKCIIDMNVKVALCGSFDVK